MTNNPDKCSPHGWTVDTLEKYLSDKITGVVNLSNEREARTAERFASSEKAVSAALAAVEKSNTAAMSASEKAISKAEIAQEKRNEASNEIRAAMVDQTSNFASKQETNFRFVALEKQVEELKTVQTATSGKSSGVAMIVAIGIGIFNVLGIVATVIYTIFVVSGGRHP